MNIDIFKGDAFSTTTMLGAVQKIPYKPQLLGSLGLFTPRPVNTEAVWIDQRDGVLTLIQTSPRGAPLAQRTTEKRAARGFRTVRVAKGDRPSASEVQGIPPFRTDNEMVVAQG